MKRILLINVFLALLVISSRAAELAVTNQVSLDAVVSDVLEHNPELNFYRAEMAVAKGERRTAGTLANPEVFATLGNKRVSGLADGVAWSVSAQQTIEWPGPIALRKAIANQQIKLAELGLAQFKAALAARTRALGAVPIATYVELRKQYLEAVEALLDTKTEALEAGQPLELLTGVPLSITNTPAKEETK